MSILNFYLESFGSEHSCHNREKYIEEYSDPKDSRQKFNIDIKIIILQDSNQAIMSSQNNMAKESYPYKII